MIRQGNKTPEKGPGYQTGRNFLYAEWKPVTRKMPANIQGCNIYIFRTVFAAKAMNMMVLR